MRTWRSLSLVPALLVLMACSGTAQTARPAGTPGGAAPAATVEAFLQLAAQKNYAQMGYLFGTREGAIINRDREAQVERRMYTIATILENQRFVIRDQSAIPGRSDAVQLNVQLTQRGQTVDVPFVLVRSGDRWFVEQIDLERITKQQ